MGRADALPLSITRRSTRSSWSTGTPSLPPRTVPDRRWARAYGVDAAAAIDYAESFEIAPYGRPTTPAEMDEILH